ncbi:hypothetical protein DI53_3401 [Sphingobacterium deserti]|uniref:Uncharacterized protein n=1 Tax=Sphingobacterium deserti TaxID=1229276 RepID=A0A0B8SZ36_9SPHI|nr:hypothetical protein DI53_3401 [Sphingobacterium deserti]
MQLITAPQLHPQSRKTKGLTGADSKLYNIIILEGYLDHLP